MTQKEFESLEIGDMVFNTSAIHRFRVRILEVHERKNGIPQSYKVQELSDSGEEGINFIAFTPMQYEFPDGYKRYKKLKGLYES